LFLTALRGNFMTDLKLFLRRFLFMHQTRMIIINSSRKHPMSLSKSQYFSSAIQLQLLIYSIGSSFI
jgi:hypothetical protein